jgi:polysaccharide export outer membrane protein
MKDMRPDILYTLSQRPELKIQQNDRLKIVVSSRSSELAAPFNIGVGGYQIGTDGEFSSTNNTTLQERGYLVDSQGNIEYPVLGILRVGGLSTQEASYLIRNHLREERIISDAIVTVDVLNFKVMVIGEVNNNGIIIVPEGRITLFEAIIRAGGVTTNAAMGEIVVMREERRGYRFLYSDLRTVAVFDSPSYFLQQNDIVYVKPITAPMSERESRTWQWYNTSIGLIGAILSAFLLINYYKK